MLFLSVWSSEASGLWKLSRHNILVGHRGDGGSEREKKKKARNKADHKVMPRNYI